MIGIKKGKAIPNRPAPVDQRGVAGFMQNRLRMMEEMKKRRKQTSSAPSVGTSMQRSGLGNTLSMMRAGRPQITKKK